MTQSTSEHPYDKLTPELVIEAVEDRGYLSDLRLLALNSYENRVYQVGIEDGEPLIVKFYRPDRWSREQIQEEHDFSYELLAADISVVAPLKDSDGTSLHEYGGFLYTLFPRRGGHPPELDNYDNLLVLGRTVGRIHAVGKSQEFGYRQDMTLERMAVESYQFLSEHMLPADLRTPYVTLAEHLVERIRAQYQEVNNIRTHGDCHVGNILWRDDTAHFVDLDDCVSAPAVQDLWMFLSGDRQQQLGQLSEVVEGYQEFCDFDTAELALIESLRTMRIMHYAAWLGRRWSDPAFPHSFPWFGDARYWSSHILELREQLAAFDEPPLALF
ncbi:MAG: serine/threonine protein kinase [Halieaceae bacterium]